MGPRLSRRGFLKALGATAAASAIRFTFAEARSLPPPKEKLVSGERIPSVCYYCGVGCGIMATVIDGRVVNIQGDRQHPINEGALCGKANAQLQLFTRAGATEFHSVPSVPERDGYGSLWGAKRFVSTTNPLRLTRPLIRTNPRKGEGEDPGWREVTWEEAYRLIEGRLGPIVEEFYRKTPLPDKDGNYVVDGGKFPIAWFGSAYSHNEENYLFRKFSVMLGTNNIEHQARRCHSTTVGALASTFGFGAMTNHIIDFKNARTILFIGSNGAENHPVCFRWVMKAKEKGAKLIVLDPRFTRSASRADIFAWFRPGTDAALFLGLINYAMKKGYADEAFLGERTDAYTEKDLQGGKVKVVERLLEVSSRYTPQEVSRITGIPEAKFVEIAEAYCRPENRPSTIIYAMGTTQHTNGTQMIRAYAILQLVLGNIGVPGGGVNAMRGISNVQGSTDMGTLFEWLPGYRRAPLGPPNHATDLRNFQKYKNMRADGKTPDEIAAAFNSKPIDLRHWATWRDGYMKNWGMYVGTYPEDDPEKGTVISDIPVGLGLSSVEIFREAKKGNIKALIIVGENPAVSNPALQEVWDALKTEGLFTVAMDLFESETAHFADVLLPAASLLEKDGTVTNTGRWIGWRNRIEAPPGEARTDLAFVDGLFKRLRKTGMIVLPSERFARDRGLKPADLGVDPDGRWSYGDPPQYEEVLKEINSAVAIYAGVMNKREDGTWENRAKRRDNKPADEMDARYGLYKNWFFSWPDNQRILYKRDETNVLKRSLGQNFFTADKRAMIYNPVQYPGPRRDAYAIPVHNEPAESPDPELARDYPPIVGGHPAAIAANKDPDFLKRIGDPKEYPIVLTTFRLTEHMHTGQLSRNLPWLIELMPEVFVEMSTSLAKRLGVKTGDYVLVKTSRKPQGLRVKAFVTNRLRPLTINGRERDVAAMPWHWGFKGLNPGESANFLTIDALDNWTRMPETKVALCAIERAV